MYNNYSNSCPAGLFTQRINGAFHNNNEVYKPSNHAIKNAWIKIIKADKLFAARFNRAVKSPDAVILDAVSAHAPELRKSPNNGGQNDNNSNNGKGNNGNKGKGKGKGKGKPPATWTELELPHPASTPLFFADTNTPSTIL